MFEYDFMVNAFAASGIVAVLAGSAKPPSPTPKNSASAHNSTPPNRAVCRTKNQEICNEQGMADLGSLRA